MKNKVVVALLLIALACSRGGPAVRQVIRRNGHQLAVANRGSHDLVVTPWRGAPPLRIARGATVVLPTSGGPMTWELFVADPATGRVVYRGTFGAGGAQTLVVSDRGVRSYWPEMDDKVRVKPRVEPGAHTAANR